jgi:Tfp pilus assembly protein PilV
MKEVKIKLDNKNDSHDKSSIRYTEDGSSLVEVIVAITILLVALLGVFASLTYAINYNSGNNARSQALAVLQQEIEQMRSKKFTPSLTDSELTGGVKTDKTVVTSDGNKFKVSVTIDDDPFTTGVQTDITKTIKEITVAVALDRPTPGWQTAVPATVILRRTRSN